MKYFKGILVVSLIFLFPGISYLYLRYGFMYRKEALEILSAQVPFTDDQVNYLMKFDTSFQTDIKTGVNVFQIIRNEQDEKDLYFLAENLRKNKDFHAFALYENSMLPTFQDTIYINVLDRLYDPSLSPTTFMGESRFILTKANKQRKSYGFQPKDMTDVYEHTVILLPMKKREKIKLVRDKEI